MCSLPCAERLHIFVCAFRHRWPCYIYIYMHTYILIYIYIYILTCIHTYVCTYAWVCMYTRISYIYTCSLLRVHRYTHKDTRAKYSTLICQCVCGAPLARQIIWICLLQIAVFHHARTAEFSRTCNVLCWYKCLHTVARQTCCVCIYIYIYTHTHTQTLVHTLIHVHKDGSLQ